MALAVEARVADLAKRLADLDETLQATVDDCLKLVEVVPFGEREDRFVA